MYCVANKIKYYIYIGQSLSNQGRWKQILFLKKRLTQHSVHLSIVECSCTKQIEREMKHMCSHLTQYVHFLISFYWFRLIIIKESLMAIVVEMNGVFVRPPFVIWDNCKLCTLCWAVSKCGWTGNLIMIITE